MRNPLYKRIPRIIKKNFIKYLGMIIILVSTICVGSSFQATLNGAVAYLEQIKDGNFQEDGFFEVDSPLSEEMLEKLHFVSKEKGLDVDKPRNLAKSVTVE